MYDSSLEEDYPRELVECKWEIARRFDP